MCTRVRNGLASPQQDWRLRTEPMQKREYRSASELRRKPARVCLVAGIRLGWCSLAPEAMKRGPIDQRRVWAAHAGLRSAGVCRVQEVVAIAMGRRASTDSEVHALVRAEPQRAIADRRWGWRRSNHIDGSCRHETSDGQRTGERSAPPALGGDVYITNQGDGTVSVVS